MTLLLDIGDASFGHFEVRMPDQRGKNCQDLITDQPSCHWNYATRCYELAFTDLKLFRKALSRRGLLEEVKTTREFKDVWANVQKWDKYLRKIKAQTTTSFDVDTAHELYDHQRVGAKFLLIRKHAICADEMGVGKSGTAIAAAWHLIQKGKVPQCLIVCPSSVKMQWAKDTIEFFLPQATYTIVGSDFRELVPVSCPSAGKTIMAKMGERKFERKVPEDHMFEPKKAPCRGCIQGPRCKVMRGDMDSGKSVRFEQYRADTHFIIVNYELLRMDALGPKKKNSKKKRDISLLDEAEVDYQLIIFDEAHRLRNAGTDTFEAIWNIAKDAPYRWGLTGTPIQTRLDDAWGVMRCLNPSVFGTSRFRFLNRYAERDMWNKVVGYIRVEEVHDKLEPNMIRRKKTEVLSLPPFVPATHYAQLSASEMKLYNGIKNQQLDESQIADETLRNELMMCEPIVTVGRCRQAALSPALVDPSLPFKSSKVKVILNVLKDAVDDHKVVLFCEYRKFLDGLTKELDTLGINHVYLHGGIPSGRLRQKLVDKFRDDEKCRVFMTTTAGGEGLNLQVADVLILANLCWNPAMIAQVKGRLHRIGQHNPVSVLTIISQDTVEERVEQDARYRTSIADVVTDGIEAPEELPLSLSQMRALL